MKIFVPAYHPYGTVQIFKLNEFFQLKTLTKDLSGAPDLPKAAQIAPNGQKYTSLMFFDFNSLYLYAQLMPFPATPGLMKFFLYFS